MLASLGHWWALEAHKCPREDPPSTQRSSDPTAPPSCQFTSHHHPDSYTSPVYHWNFGLAISRSELQLLGNVSLSHEKQWRQQGGCKEKSGSKSRSGFTWAIDHPLIYAIIMLSTFINTGFQETYLIGMHAGPW